ncbi:PrgI family protein [Candidatus Nomurabacteria bacterium]|nr:PrgI family protein [Candidatus Nomurabacteria bacterium]
MATHKVPQDVETEDKIIGFLSLKQFIFVVVGIGFGWLTFFFATRVNVILALIWIPFTVVPLVLGLYQRKDQPVEVFLASALRFYFKPRKRKWDQEGYEERVLVTAPPKVEHHYTKDFSGEEAMSRLTRLSRMMDSRGWASKLSGEWQNPQLAAAATSDARLVQPANLATNDSGYLQTYMQPTDVMDEQTSVVAKDFQYKIDATDTSAQVGAMKTMDAARATSDNPAPHVEKYPDMRQSVVKPITADTITSSAPDPVAPPVVQDDATEPENDVQQPIKSSTYEPKVQKSDDGSVEISLH